MALDHVDLEVENCIKTYWVEKVLVLSDWKVSSVFEDCLFVPLQRIFQKQHFYSPHHHKCKESSKSNIFKSNSSICHISKSPNAAILIASSAKTTLRGDSWTVGPSIPRSLTWSGRRAGEALCKATKPNKLGAQEFQCIKKSLLCLWET